MTEKSVSPKKAAVTLLVFTLTGLILASVPFAYAQGTEVTGSISADTRWTKANSPYAFTGPVFLTAGVSLLIDSGVTVNFNSHVMQVNGVLYAEGNKDDPILLNNGKIVFTSSSGAWNEQTQTGCLIENAVFTSCKIEFQDASPKIASNAFKRGSITVVGVNPHVSGSNALILNNNIIGTTQLGSGISISGNNHVKISGNVIAGWNDGILAGSAQYASDSYPSIERNLIINNTHGIRIELSIRDSWGNNFPAIKENSIIQNLAGIRVTCNWERSGNPDDYVLPTTIQNNNIYENSGSNAVGACTLNVNNNWWGTTNTQSISRTVESRYMYVPFLMSSYASAPGQSYNPNPSFASTITPSLTNAPGETANTQPTNPPSSTSFIPQQMDVQADPPPKFPTGAVVAVVVAVLVAVIGVFLVRSLYRKRK